MHRLFRFISIKTLFLSSLFAFPATADVPVFLGDINTAEDQSFPDNFFVHNNLMYFIADDEIHDHEIWVTDGTVAGTRLLRDINPGNGDVNENESVIFIGVGNTVFFRAEDGFNGVELWKTDGTEEGTVLVKDINPQINEDGEPNGSFPRNFAALGSTLFFSAFDEENGRQLWMSDGTESGTVAIQTLANDLEDVDNIAVLDADTILFSGENTVNGNELFKYDVGANNAVLVKDIIPLNGGENSNPRNFTLFNGEIYFTANNGFSTSVDDNENGTELWKSDGTTAGTEMVGDINLAPGESSSPQELFVFDNELYFSAFEPTNGQEVWRTNTNINDGSVVLELAHDINTNNSGQDSSSPRNFLAVNGLLIFGANGGDNARRVWVSDGTTTTLLNNVAEITSDIFSNGTNAFFSANDGTNGSEPWISDGTVIGTTLLQDIATGDESSEPDEYAFLGDQIFIGDFEFSFGTENGDVSNPPNELWVSDGTTPGTVLFADLNTATDSSNPDNMTDFNGTLIFNARSTTQGNEIWTSDGTPEGTQILKDISPGIFSSDATDIQTVGALFYFTAFDGTTSSVWRSDGTEDGTFPIVTEFFELDSRFGFVSLDQQTTFFVGITNNDGNRALWKTDGTVEGTEIFVDLDDSIGSELGESIVDGNRFFFSAPNTGGPAPTLWVSDGTSDGTVPVKQIDDIDFFSMIGNTVYFFAAGNSGDALWETDGTEVGTQIVSDVFDRQLGRLATLGNELFFFAEQDAFGTELWKSDGTTSGTVMVRDIVSGEEGIEFDDSQVEGLILATNRAVFFVIDDGIAGAELWTSNGTEQGTFMLRNIDNSPRGSDVDDLTVVGNAVYFEANDRIHGEELWITKGTTASTRLLEDFLEGPGSSDPDDILLIGNSLFMELEDGVHGDELFRYDIPVDDGFCVPIRTQNNRISVVCL